MHYGAEALSNQELLAILFTNGSHPFNVIELAGQILNEFEDLYELKHVTLTNCRPFVGRPDQSDRTQSYRRTWRPHPTKAAQPKYGRVHSSVDIANQMMEELKDYQQEHLLCLYLNTKNEIIQKRRYSSAVSISRLLILEKFITEQFVACRPSDLVHNHPSGSPQPSQADTFTKTIDEVWDDGYRLAGSLD